MSAFRGVMKVSAETRDTNDCERVPRKQVMKQKRQEPGSCRFLSARKNLLTFC